MTEGSRYTVTIHDHHTEAEATVQVDGEDFAEALWMAYGRMLADRMSRTFDTLRPSRRWKFQ